MKSLISNNSKRAQQLFLKLYKTIHFNAIYIIEVFTKYGNFLAKTDIEARGATPRIIKIDLGGIIVHCRCREDIMVLYYQSEN